MVYSALNVKVELRKQAKIRYPGDTDKQRKFMDGVLTKLGLKQGDNLKELRQVIAKAFRTDG